MRVHFVIVAASAWFGACAAPSTPPPRPSGEQRTTSAPAQAQEAMAMGERVLAAYFEQNPSRATMLRVPGARFDKLSDHSVSGVLAREERYAAWLGEMRGIDRSGLEAAATAGTSYDVAHEYLEGQLALRPCRYELWTVSPSVNGWMAELSTYAQVQPVRSEGLRAQALARWGAMPAYIDTEIANLREGLRLGYVAYAGSVRATMEQLDRLLATPADRSPLLEPADRDATPEFRAKLVALIGEGILPAVRRYRAFLEQEYMPHARSAPGLIAEKEGDLCYRGTLRAFTTLDLDPRKVHETGWAELAKVEAQMKEISARSFGGADLRTLLDRFREDPSYRYRGRDDMLDQARAAVARARAAMPRAFGLLPPDDVRIEPIPAFLEKSSAHHYQAAALDGSRAATYRIRLYQAEQQSRVLGESTAFHETIPGHHLQIDIAMHRPDVPPIARFLFNSGYAEGWGLYAEQLADELGLYTSDADRFGMLSNRAWRAVRLIVDSGVHALGWDRQKAIETMLAHTATSADFAAAEVDRYVAWPGQACSYMIGYLEIRALREEAEKALGPRFDLKAFHDRVLENGSEPLPVLKRKIDAWLAKELSRRGG